MTDKKLLLEQFSTMSHEDKHAKVLVYLDLMRQKTSKFVWLFGLVNVLWLDIQDDTLENIYATLLGIVDYGQEHKLDHIISSLEEQQLLKQKNTDAEEQEKKDADSLLDTI